MPFPIDARAAIAVALLAASCLRAQPLKRTPEPPVILLNGYQLACSSGPGDSTGTFGRLEQLLRENDREVRFFDNCTQGRVNIERLARGFGEFLAELRYEDGTPVEQVDLIGHSMGGLIARAYLSGKRDDGSYQPPVPRRVRKLVTLSTPNFGADFGGNAIDPQTAQMIPGSTFLWELATWNQGKDDLRGVDTLAIAARSRDRASDGLVSALSASGYFIANLPPDRSRVVSACHVTGLGALVLGCQLTERGVANVNNAEHPVWLLVRGFLTEGSDSWRMLSPAEGDPELSAQSSLWISYLDASGNMPAAVTASFQEGEALKRYMASPALFVERTVQRDATLEIKVDAQPAASIAVTLGRGVRTLPVKDGPAIDTVEMASAAEGISASSALTLAPDASIRIRGAKLTGVRDVSLDGMALDFQVDGDGGLVAKVPMREPGTARLLVRAEGGEHAVRVLFGPVPARFETARPRAKWNAVAGAAGYVLWVGSEAGKSDLFEGKMQQETEAELTLPEGPAFVRLWTLIGGDWHYRDVAI